MRILKLLVVATTAIFFNQAFCADAEKSSSNVEAMKIVQKFYSEAEATLSRNRRKPGLTEAEARALSAEKEFLAVIALPSNEKLRLLYALQTKARIAANFTRERDVERSTGDVNNLVGKYETFISGLRTEIQILESAAK